MSSFALENPPSSQPVDQTAMTHLLEGIRQTHLEVECHPLVEKVVEEAEGYYIKRWPFSNEAERQRFLGAGFARSVCYCLPKALDDRITNCCIVLTLFFLIDDQLEDMSTEDGRAYVEHLIPLFRGEGSPDRAIASESIAWDIWHVLRTEDEALAENLLEQSILWTRFATGSKRANHMSFVEYLDYREGDVGMGLVEALMLYSMGLTLTSDEAEITRPLFRNLARHLSSMNDIWSYEKEKKKAQESTAEGAILFSGVSVLQGELELDTPAIKRVLYFICREWELRHKAMVQDILARMSTPNLVLYTNAMQYTASGSEAWSHITTRYKAL